MSHISSFFNNAETPAIVLFALITLFLTCGEIITQKTKALVPSFLIFALLLALAVWLGIIPQDIVARVGLEGPLFTIASILIVVNMGTTLQLKDITSNWRIALVSLAALLGVVIFCCTLGTVFFGWEQAVVATPVVGGGIVAALDMQQAAHNIGSDELATMAILIFTLHSLPAYLIISSLFKKVMKKDLATQNKIDMMVAIAQKNEIETETKTLIPEKYWNTSTILFALAIVGCFALVSNLICQLFMGSYALSVSIFALIYGIIFTQLRLLPRDAANKAGIGGLIFFIVIVVLLSAVASSSPEQILKLLVPICGMIFLGITGIFLLSFLVGKVIFKYDWRLALIMGLNCLLGFPINYLLTLQAIEFSTDDATEKEYLTNKYVPMMLVAGFVSITIGSVVLAGIMKGFL